MLRAVYQQVSFSLKFFMVEWIDSCDWKEKPMKRLKTSSQQHQYLKKAWELQWPWTMTTHGSTPIKSRWVVPPTWKLWPLTDVRPSASHIALQWSINQDHHIGDHVSMPVSKANRGVELGMDLLEERWCLKAVVALHWHVESVILISSPFSFILVCGGWKLMNFRPLAAVLHLTSVEWDTCEEGSKFESMISSPSL